MALSLSSLILNPDKPILDLACGCGHITRHLLQRAQAQAVIGVDRDFFSLYLAKGWMAPKAEYVCSAADISLPFPDDAFSTVFCLNAFQIFDHKVSCMRELKRLTQETGLIVLVAVRNALVKKHLYGNATHRALPPAGYEALVSDMPHRLIRAVTEQMSGTNLTVPERAGASLWHAPYVRVKTAIGTRRSNTNSL